MKTYLMLLTLLIPISCRTLPDSEVQAVAITGYNEKDTFYFYAVTNKKNEVLICSRHCLQPIEKFSQVPTCELAAAPIRDEWENAKEFEYRSRRFRGFGASATKMHDYYAQALADGSKSADYPTLEEFDALTESVKEGKLVKFSMAPESRSTDLLRAYGRLQAMLSDESCENLELFLKPQAKVTESPTDAPKSE